MPVRDEERGRKSGRARSAPAVPGAPPRGRKDILWRIYNRIYENHLLAMAAGVTFYMLLAIFPAIAALVAIYSSFADPATIRSHLESLSGVLPSGALTVIGDQITRVSEQGGKTLGFAFLAGLAVSLWSANAGIKAVFDALNAVYEENEKRGFFRLNAISLSFTLLGILLVVLALAAMVVLPRVLAYLRIADAMEFIVKIGRWPLLLLAVGIAIDFVYRFGPSREKAKWRWLTWGSAFAAIVWFLMSLAFTWYAASFGRFNETYGSLGAVIGFMIWLWLSNVVLLVGAQINAEIGHRAPRDTAPGGPKPMGRRGAKMAGTVGH